MQKRILILTTLVLLYLSTLSYSDELRIRPHRLNPNGKRAVMKAEIKTENPKSVDTTNMTLNGVSALRTHVTPKKVIAFFSKKDVVATLGEVQKGQTYTLSLSFSQNAQPSTLTDEIKIVGKKKNGHANH
jgi:hypothetical protein